LRFVLAVLLGPTGAGTPAAQLLDLSPPPDLTAAPADAERSASRLESRVLTPGFDASRPRPTDFVTLRFVGWTTDGNVIDRSTEPPPMFPLNRTLPGFRECVGLMGRGERRRCWLPESLAYQGAPARPAGPVVFDIELLDARRAPSDPPEAVSGPPADALRTPSGVGFQRLRTGTGTRRPTEGSEVSLHYTGWTTDGVWFDSSLPSGRPRTVRLADLAIPGLVEGLQLMVEGDRMRFWIPETLGYEPGQVGAPRGMLVFETELTSVRN
jgi:peptidylprolyl isomerase